MKRALIVLAALLLGLVGLLMSLCGGGVMIMSATGPTELSIISIALPSLLVGIILVWLSVAILRRKLYGKGWRREP